MVKEYILERAIEVSAYDDVIQSLQRNDQIYTHKDGERYMFCAGPHETDGNRFKFMNIYTNEKKMFDLGELDYLRRTKGSVEDY